MDSEQLTAIEQHWRNRSKPVYLYDRDRGLINATDDVLALVDALHEAWRELDELRPNQSDRESS